MAGMGIIRLVCVASVACIVLPSVAEGFNLLRIFVPEIVKHHHHTKIVYIPVKVGHHHHHGKHHDHHHGHHHHHGDHGHHHHDHGHHHHHHPHKHEEHHHHGHHHHKPHEEHHHHHHHEPHEELHKVEEYLNHFHQEDDHKPIHEEIYRKKEHRTPLKEDYKPKKHEKHIRYHKDELHHKAYNHPSDPKKRYEKVLNHLQHHKHDKVEEVKKPPEIKKVKDHHADAVIHESHKDRQLRGGHSVHSANQESENFVYGDDQNDEEQHKELDEHNHEDNKHKSHAEEKGHGEGENSLGYKVHEQQVDDVPAQVDHHGPEVTHKANQDDANNKVQIYSGDSNRFHYPHVVESAWFGKHKKIHNEPGNVYLYGENLSL